MPASVVPSSDTMVAGSRTELPARQPGAGWLTARWWSAVVREARPRQWPKNLLVFAAPLAGATMGRPDGLAYAILAALAFGCASASVYFVNDVMDAERDRRHPAKRNRPIASGDLPVRDALVVAVILAVLAVGARFALGEPVLAAGARGVPPLPSFLFFR